MKLVQLATLVAGTAVAAVALTTPDGKPTSPSSPCGLEVHRDAGKHQLAARQATTTMTVYTTSIQSVYVCGPGISDCPEGSTVPVVVQTVAITTTAFCPVYSTSTSTVVSTASASSSGSSLTSVATFSSSNSGASSTGTSGSPASTSSTSVSSSTSSSSSLSAGVLSAASSTSTLTSTVQLTQSYGFSLPVEASSASSSISIRTSTLTLATPGSSSVASTNTPGSALSSEPLTTVPIYVTSAHTMYSTLTASSDAYAPVGTNTTAGTPLRPNTNTNSRSMRLTSVLPTMSINGTGTLSGNPIPTTNGSIVTPSPSQTEFNSSGLCLRAGKGLAMSVVVAAFFTYFG